jgi:hypothetical protein
MRESVWLLAEPDGEILTQWMNYFIQQRETPEEDPC